MNYGDAPDFETTVPPRPLISKTEDLDAFKKSELTLLHMRINDFRRFAEDVRETLEQLHIAEGSQFGRLIKRATELMK